MTPDQRAVIQAAVDELDALATHGTGPGRFPNATVARMNGMARAARDALAKLLEDGDA